MWQALLFEGWKPPKRDIDEAEYLRLKSKKDANDPLTAYAGYGLSFGASYFNTYARSKTLPVKTYVAKFNGQIRRGVEKKRDALLKIPNLLVECCGYESYEGTKGGVFYLDPPYKERLIPYGDIKSFDHVKFWDFARRLSKDNVVFVTEYLAPEDWVAVHEFGDTVVRHYMGKGKDATNECIWMHPDGKQ